MKSFICFMVILLTGSCAFGNPYKYQWRTPRKDIEREHRLDVFKLDPLQENLDTYLGKDEAIKFVLYVVDSMKYSKYCGKEFFSIMAFYEDSLVFYFLSTEEMPYMEDSLDNECLEKTFLETGELVGYRPIFKSTEEDGNIFLEGAFCGLAETENDYLVSLTSLGQRGFLNPDHLQFAYFFFDRDFLDDIQKTMNIHKDQKSALHPTVLFIEYLVDDYKSLQEPRREE